jgi:hypothetical protein
VQAKASWTTEVQKERTSQAAVNPLLRLLKLWVIAQVGDAQKASDTRHVGGLRLDDSKVDQEDSRDEDPGEGQDDPGEAPDNGQAPEGSCQL